VHTITLCAVAALLTAAAALTWWGSDPVAVRSNATLVLAVGVVLTLWTVLQCIPLPMPLLNALAPHNAEVWSRTLAPLREAGPAWAPLSLDPVATRIEALKGATYLLAFVTALRIARRRRGAIWLNYLLVATGVVLAVAALLHPAFGAHRVFGVYEPSSPIAARHIAPLLNPNNLAGYLNVALCIAVAGLVAPQIVVPRVISAAVVLFLGATQLWVASRGGVIAMGLGVVIAAVAAQVGRSEPQGARVGLTVIAGIGTAIGVVLTILAGSESASDELFAPDVSKIQLIKFALHMLPAVPLFGCGRGAFASAFSAFRSGFVGHVTMEYPENVVAQWILEWGVPVGLGAIVVLVYALRPGVVEPRSSRAAGAWAAVVALSVQQLCDLGSEVPGLVLAGVVCCGVVLGGSPAHRQAWRLERWPRPPARVALGAALVGCLAIVAGITGIGLGRDDDEHAIHAAAVERLLPPKELEAVVRPMLLRHPADPYLPFAVALRDARDHEANPMPWIGATLERAPVYPPAHLVLAGLLGRRSPSQARLEYRLAMEQMPDLVGPAVGEATPLVKRYDDALELVPAGKSRVSALQTLAWSLRSTLPATSVRLDELASREAPAEPGPLQRLAQGKVDDLRQPWCQGDHRVLCVTAALRASADAWERAPLACEPRVLHARARAAGGDVAGAVAELQASSEHVSDRAACLRELVGLAAEVGTPTQVTDALDRVSSAGCGPDDDCTKQLVWVAQTEEARGFPRRALANYRRALDWSPSDEAVLAAIGRLAAQLGLHAEAADAYAHLVRLHPNDAKWRKAEVDERASALKGGFGTGP
jgi:hypothetical protein